MAKGKAKSACVVKQVSVDQLWANKWNRVVDTKSEGFRALTANISKVGQQVPILVRPIHGEKEAYEIVDGQRRWNALCILELPMAHVEIREMQEDQARAITAIINLHREPMSPFEEAGQVRGLLGQCDGDIEATAMIVGQTPRWVRERVQLENLTVAWKKALANDPRFTAWGIGHLILIARMPAETQDHLLLIRYRFHAPTSIKSLRHDVAEYERFLRKANFKIDDGKLFKKAGPCTACMERTGALGLLFHDQLDSEDITKNDRCLDPKCWDKKEKARVKATVAAAIEKHPTAPRISSQYGRCSRGVFTPYEYSKAKKIDKGAVQAVVVAGSDAGKVQFVVLKKKTPDSSRSGDTTTVTKDMPPKERLNAMKAKLARDRNRELMEKVGDILLTGDGMIRPPEKDLILLAASCGVFWTWEMTRKVKKNDPMSWMKQLAKKGREAILDRIWQGVRGSVIEDLRGDLTNSMAAHLIDTNGPGMAVLQKKTAEAIPEPKEMVKLRAEIKAAKKPKAKIVKKSVAKKRAKKSGK